jgi:serine/threonine protein kinase/tetratricopeptide (TPR) repeat protein
MQLDPARIEEIFGEAVARTDAMARAAYVDQACGADSDLRERIESLLAGHDAAGDFLKLPCEDEMIFPPQGAIPGLTIGHYKLLEQIGEGGFAVVFMAQQEQPVRRLVALKIIKLGMDTKQVIARFEAERQALAMMDHASIAKVFDAGTSDTGRPYFVMELVKGAPITEYCDHETLNIEERLDLFLQVCEAVQHAHQKGIIHRDIKPSNVLVSTQDGRPLVKVIDFGVAKAMQGQLTEKTLFTEFRQLIGTPAYMSPEQAGGSLDIDTRSDVYSLGVLLYELLAGAPPFDPRDLRSKAFAEMQRIICEVEPPTPSTRFSGLAADTQASNAARRHSDAKRLGQRMRGDLDWIIMRCLEKDRARRYQSASALAEDIHHYLTDRPVMAKPPTRTYQVKKFIRRNKAAVLAGSAIVAALVVGLTLAAVGFVQARRQAEIARTEATRAEAARADEALQRERAEQRRIEADQARAAEAAQRKIAEDERNRAEKRRARAETSFHNALNAIDTYFSALRENKLLNVPALQALRKELLGSALAYYREFIDQHRDDSALEAELANAYLRIGELTQMTGPNEQAIEAYQQAIRRYEQLAHDHPETREYWADLADAHEQLGGLDRSKRRFERAEASYTRALDIRQKLAQEKPNDRECESNFARLHVKLGLLQASAEQLSEAEASFHRALRIYERLAKEEPGESAYRFNLADTYYSLGPLQCATGRLVDAEASLERAAQIFEQLSREVQSDYYLERVAGASYRLGHVKRIAGQFDAARASYARALELYERLGRADPSSGNYPRSMGGARFHLGLVQSVGGQKDEAMQNWTTALADFRAATELGYESAGFISSRSGALAMLGRWPEAADILTKSLDAADYHWRPHCQIALLRWAGGDEAGHRAACSELVARRASQATGAEASAIATACVVGANAVENGSDLLAIAQRAVKADPGNPVPLTLLGAALFRVGQTGDALKTLERAVPLHPSTESASPLLDPIRASRVLCETMLMLVHRERKDKEALARQVQSLEALVAQMKSTGPVYCDEGDNWRLGFAVLFAERELVRRQEPAAR